MRNIILKQLIQRIHDSFPFTPGWRLFADDAGFQATRKHLPIVYFRRLPAMLRWLLVAALFFYWPFRIIFLCAAFARKFGKQVRQKMGKRTLMQFAEQFWLALACGVHPREYYALELFEDGNKKTAHFFYFLSDMRRVPMINLGKTANPDAIVNNKRIFEDFCVAENLAHISSRATLLRGDVRYLDEVLGQLPDGEYVLKPFIGWRGEGMIFFTKELLCFRIQGGSELSHSETVSALAAPIHRADYLLQPRLYNHEGLRNIGNGSLLSFRIVSLLNEDGRAELLSAIAQIPFKQQLVSNKGLIAPVDELGVLGAGQLLRPLSPVFTAPPEGGHTFSGITVPRWNEAVDLALRAHSALGAYISLGWDVAITPQGPVLLEANCGWDPTMMQKSHGMPLGKTKLPEMLLFHCK